jgi:hypothetical protein
MDQTGCTTQLRKRRNPPSLGERNNKHIVLIRRVLKDSDFPFSPSSSSRLFRYLKHLKRTEV